jgi:D-methionine transport system ATP-binding protein
MPLVSLRDVAKRYPSPQKGAAPIAAIDGVDLDIEAGDVFGIIGYSGAGKSTLVRLINALEPATSGSIVVDGTEVTTLSERGLRDLRLGIGMIFQQFNLFNSKSVRKNIAYPLEVAGRPRAEIRTRVDELLKFVGLSDKADNYPDQLSGGQKQRVGIARALATSPRILLADEATSALDPETTQEVLALLKQVNRDLGVTIVVITHEMEVIQSLATKVAVMERGKVIEQGDVFEVFSDPQHAASKRFVSTRRAHRHPVLPRRRRLAGGRLPHARAGGRRLRARLRRDQRHPGSCIRPPDARPPRRRPDDRRSADRHRIPGHRDGGALTWTH